MNVLTESVDKKLNNLVDKKIISEENRIYLKGENIRLGRFYLLPKIHKRLVNVPGRPVISNCGTATEGISEFVDFHLRPIVQQIPQVIKDTMDLLCKLKRLGNIPDKAIIFSMDMVRWFLSAYFL